MNEITLATNNPGKISEIQKILSPIRLIAQETLGIQSPEETGLSFIENAIIKARYASRLSHRPALADDSGLVVPALKGQPGIYSARYAGKNATSQENIELLLHRLEYEADRQAYFYCVIVLVQYAEDPMPIVATGQCVGEITRTPHGEQGFGYDPIFYSKEYQCTFAELPPTIKNTISHRAQALLKLKNIVTQAC